VITPKATLKYKIPIYNINMISTQPSFLTMAFKIVAIFASTKGKGSKRKYCANEKCKFLKKFIENSPINKKF
jgi:hypothetical protein